MSITYDKISQLTSATSNSSSADFFAVSVYNGSTYDSRKITAEGILSGVVDGTTTNWTANKKISVVGYNNSNWDSVYSTVSATSSFWGTGGLSGGYGYDGVTIGVTGTGLSSLYVKDGAITNVKLATGIDAAKITVGSFGASMITTSATNTALTNVGSNVLGVNVDNSTIKINGSNKLYAANGVQNIIVTQRTRGGLASTVTSLLAYNTPDKYIDITLTLSENWCTQMYVGTVVYFQGTVTYSGSDYTITIPKGVVVSTNSLNVVRLRCDSTNFVDSNHDWTMTSGLINNTYSGLVLKAGYFLYIVGMVGSVYEHNDIILLNRQDFPFIIYFYENAGYKPVWYQEYNSKNSFYTLNFNITYDGLYTIYSAKNMILCRKMDAISTYSGISYAPNNSTNPINTYSILRVTTATYSMTDDGNVCATIQLMWNGAKFLTSKLVGNIDPY